MSRHNCTVRMSEDVHEIVKEIAVRDKRSISFIVEQAVIDYVNKQKQNDTFVVKTIGQM